VREATPVRLGWRVSRIRWLETVRKLCTTLDVKIASFAIHKDMPRHSTGPSTLPNDYSCSWEPFSFGNIKTAFHKGEWLRLCFDVSFWGVRHERCDVYADVFTATDIVLYIIHLLTYDDIVAINIITADHLDRTYTWCFWWRWM